MYLSMWLSAIALALLATWTIAVALPTTADEELSRAFVSEKLLDGSIPALPHWLAKSICPDMRAR